MDDIGVLTWRELIAIAGSEERARRLLAAGAYRRVLRGVYAADAAPDGPGLRAAALKAALPAGVVLSGRAALWALGVDALQLDGQLDMTTVRGAST